MSWSLVDEVLGHAPPGLTVAERHVLVVLADFVHQADYRAGSRRTERTHAEVATRAGMTVAALRQVLYRLANPPKAHAGRLPLDVRVPLGTDARGRPLYAVRGRKPTFRVPVLPPPPGCTCATCTAPKVGPQSDDPGPKVGPQSQTVGQESDQPATTVRPNRGTGGTEGRGGRRRPLPPPCGRCDARPGDAPSARVREVPGGRVQLCPECHPDARQDGRRAT